MSILNVNTIQPIGSGTTVTVAATELKTSNFITVGTGASVTSPSANVLTLGTNSAERLRITSAGLIGIGTVSPSGPVHAHTASGTQRSYLEASAAHSFLRLKSGSTSYNSGVEFFSGASNIANINGLGAGGLQFEVNGSERLRITSGGSVAIGVNSPSDILHVGGNNAFIRVDRPNGNPGLTLIYNSTNSTRADIDVTTGGDLRFATNSSTERLRIDSNGRIGTNGRAPSSYNNPNLLISGDDATLTIMGDGSTNNSSIAAIKFRVAGASAGDYTKAGIFVQRQDSYNDLDMIFAFRSTNDAAGVAISDEKLRIDSDGKLLIGTTSNFVRGQVQIIAGGGGELTIGRSDTSVGSGNDLGHIFFASNDSGTTPSAGAAAISCYADAAHTSSSAPASLRFLTCESGSVNTTERLRIHAAGHGQFYEGAVTRVVCGSDIALGGTSKVNDEIPSWANKITVILYRASLDGTADFLIQLRVNGSDIQTNYNSGSANHTGNTHKTSTEGFIIANTNAGHKTSGRMVIERIGTDNKWVATHMVIQDSGQAPRYGAGDLSNYSGTISGIKIKDTGSNSFDNGTFTVIAEA